jgi:small-conductance mechanosensitive channel
VTLPQQFWETAGATILFVAFAALVHILTRAALARLLAWRKAKADTHTGEILPLDRITVRLGRLLKFLRLLLIAIGFLLLVSYELKLFPETKYLGSWLLEQLLQPFVQIFRSFLDYIPSLFNLFAILLVTRYGLAVIRRIFHQIEAGRLTINGFYPEWASPTYKLVRFFVLALSLVAMFPYLPGSSSPAFQGISVFLGLLLSLGSTSLVSNIVSGTVLTYMRALKIGDRVKVGETYGDVIERTMLVTRVRTIQNEIVTIPNALLLNGQIINYTTDCTTQGLILRITVTIGYDASWPRVHEALLAAAARTPLVLQDPAPFVLQTALNDYNVSYALNAYTRDAGAAHLTEAALHQNIQDTFSAAGIEILSPMYNAIRQSISGDTMARS